MERRGSGRQYVGRHWFQSIRRAFDCRSRRWPGAVCDVDDDNHYDYHVYNRGSGDDRSTGDDCRSDNIDDDEFVNNDGDSASNNGCDDDIDDRGFTATGGDAVDGGDVQAEATGEG